MLSDDELAVIETQREDLGFNTRSDLLRAVVARVKRVPAFFKGLV